MDEGLAKIRHSRSKKDFPFLKLEDDEYVEFSFMRARSYLNLLLGGLAVGLVIVLLVFLLVMVSQPSLGMPGRNFLMIVLAVMVAAAVIAALLIGRIYKGNRLFVTNKHVIQMTMDAPMASSVNMIDLSSIEDASFSQNGLMEKILSYGTLRLSTVGDETTYTFKYASVSPEELKGVSKLIVAAKKKSAKNSE